mgnify:CR=1 FL=1
MLNIAIIGCGQIGSRHLQALATMKQGAIFYLVDSSNQSIETSKKRFKEAVTQNDKSKFEIKVRKIDKIECDLDFAIISSTSSSRAMLTERLLSCTKVKYIIFEKFLFQNKNDYRNIQNLLKEKKVKAWVNQWMSSSIPFKEMAEWFGPDLEEITIVGQNWGMGCNSVHYLEYLDEISGRRGLTVTESNLDSKVIESKRPGYYELTGSVTIKSETGIKMTLVSENLETDGIVNFQMTGKSKGLEATLSNEILKCNYDNKLSGKTSKEYTIQLQSEKTGDIVEGISNDGSCALPTYGQSMKQHLMIFDCFQSVFKKQFKLSNTCPIT